MLLFVANVTERSTFDKQGKNVTDTLTCRNLIRHLEYRYEFIHSFLW